jgi:hypothetical protein
MLRDELLAMGLSDAVQTEKGIVLATLPGNAGGHVPVVAFNAHVDTSPETTGEGVRPQVVRRYDGGDLPLPGNPQAVIRVEANEELRGLVGCTIITTDGTTLLGADDKAGLAVIMEAAACLQENPQIEHGPLRICFTCDEEIGHGVDHVDLTELGATVCYTLDGHGCDEIDVETFSADLAVVTIEGVNIHPSIAKGRMTNAVRAAAYFVERLPRDTLSPETTGGREGFLHPYQIAGGVGEVTLRILLRDFVAGGGGGRRGGAVVPPPAGGARARPPRRAVCAESHRTARPRAEADDHSRRHRRLAVYRIGAAYAESLDRRAQSSLSLGMDLPGGDGKSGPDARRAGADLGPGERVEIAVGASTDSLTTGTSPAQGRHPCHSGRVQ